MFDSVCFLITTQCNMACPYCYRLDSKQSFVSTSEYVEGLRILKKMGTQIVNITGGEPLLHPQWKEYILAAKEMGFIVNLTTNALLLDPNDKALSALDMLAISCDGIELSDKKNRTGDQLEKCVHIFERFQNEKFVSYLKINTVVTKANIEALGDFAQRYLNCESIIWMPFSYKRKGIFNKMSQSLEVSDDEFLSFISGLSTLNLKCRVMIDHSIDSLENKNTYFLLTPDLDLFFCTWRDDIFICNIIKDGYKQAFKRIDELGIDYRFVDRTGEVEYVTER